MLKKKSTDEMSGNLGQMGRPNLGPCTFWFGPRISPSCLIGPDDVSPDGEFFAQRWVLVLGFKHCSILANSQPMAEEAAQELPETKPGPAEEATTEDVELGTAECSPNDGAAVSETDEVTNGKRSRDGGGEGDEEEEGEPKKLKVENSVEEERPDEDSCLVKLAAKEFGSSVQMYDYFFKFLHFWPPNISVNKVR